MTTERRGAEELDGDTAGGDAAPARRPGSGAAFGIGAAVASLLALSVVTPLGHAWTPLTPSCDHHWSCLSIFEGADARRNETPLDLGPLETADIDRLLERAERDARRDADSASADAKREAEKRAGQAEEEAEDTLFGPAAALKRIEDARAAVEEAENGRRRPPELNARRLWTPTGGLWRVARDDPGWVAAAVIQIGQRRPDMLGLFCTHPAIDGAAYLQAGLRPPPPPSTDGFVFYVGQRFFRRLSDPRKDARPYFLEFDVIGADGQRILRQVVAFTFDRGRGLFVSGIEARAVLLRAFMEGARVTVREDETGAKRSFALSGSRDAITAAAQFCGLALTAPSRPTRGVPSAEQGPNGR